jgi:hypothetical protein
MQTKILAEQIAATRHKISHSEYMRLAILPCKLESIVQMLNTTCCFEAYSLYFFFFGSGSYDRTMRLLYDLHYYVKASNYSLLLSKMDQLIDNIRSASHELKLYLVEYMAKNDVAAPAEQRLLLAELRQKIQSSDKQIVRSFSAVLNFLCCLQNYGIFFRPNNF